jgi:hypothetical protein
MKNSNKVILTVGAILVLGIIWVLYDGYFWTERSMIKGRLLYLVDANGQRTDSWALINQPFSWGITVKLQDIPSELKSEGTTIECHVVSMDTSEGNPGIDGYAVVDNCERK